MGSLKNQNVLVVGATGLVGRGIVKRLLEESCVVTAAARRSDKLDTLSDECKNSRLTTVSHVYLGISKYVKALFTSRKMQPFNALVYTPGLCSSHSLIEEVAHPLSRLPLNRWEETMNTYVRGFFHCMSAIECEGMLKDNGCVVAVSSGITQFSHIPVPKADLRVTRNSWHYIAAKVCLETMVRGYRFDGKLAEKNIRVQLVRPPAISDSPLHTNAPAGYAPTFSVSSKAVVDGIIEAIKSPGTVDVDWEEDTGEKPIITPALLAS